MRLGNRESAGGTGLSDGSWDGNLGIGELDSCHLSGRCRSFYLKNSARANQLMGLSQAKKADPSLTVACRDGRRSLRIRSHNGIL